MSAITVPECTPEEWMKNHTLDELLDIAVERQLIPERPPWCPYKRDVVELLTGEREALPVRGKGRRETSEGITELIAEIADRAIDDALGKRGDLIPDLRVRFEDRPEVKIEGISHEKLPVVLHLAQAGIPILLVGPAGSGKTKLAAQVAEALSLPFTFNSMSAGVTESSLLGRVLPDDAGNWSYRPSPFFRTYEQGAVHLFDEIDAADPNLMVIVNAAIANGKLAVPFTDLPPISRHERTYILAAANTYGNGADVRYVGRNALDAATLDRFLIGTVEVGYDQKLERAIAAALLDPEQAEDLLAWAWSVRSRIEEHRLRRIMSTRVIENAARRMACGATFEDVRGTYFLAWSEDERRQVGADA